MEIQEKEKADVVMEPCQCAMTVHRGGYSTLSEAYGAIVSRIIENGYEIVLKRVEEVCPDVIICVGQAGGRSGITPEQVSKKTAVEDSAAMERKGEETCRLPSLPLDCFVKGLQAAVEAL